MAASKLVVILALGMAFFLGACAKSDSADEPAGGAKQPNQSLALAGDFTFDLSLVMEFEQGKRAEYPISSTLPPEYKWELTAENLPKGASFEDDVLVWQPSCSFSVKDGDFIRGYLVRYVRFVWTAKDAGIVLPANAALIVHKYNGPGLCQESL